MSQLLREVTRMRVPKQIPQLSQGLLHGTLRRALFPVEVLLHFMGNTALDAGGPVVGAVQGARLADPCRIQPKSNDVEV